MQKVVIPAVIAFLSSSVSALAMLAAYSFLSRSSMFGFYEYLNMYSLSELKVLGEYAVIDLMIFLVIFIL